MRDDGRVSYEVTTRGSKAALARLMTAVLHVDAQVLTTATVKPLLFDSDMCRVDVVAVVRFAPGELSRFASTAQAKFIEEHEPRVPRVCDDVEVYVRFVYEFGTACEWEARLERKRRGQETDMYPTTVRAKTYAELDREVQRVVDAWVAEARGE